MRFSVRNKLILFVSLILLIPCLLIGWSSYHTASKQVLDKTTEGMQRNVQVINTGIDQIVSSYKQDIAFLVQIVDATTVGKSKDENPELGAIFSNFKMLHNEINAVGVVTDQGGYAIAPKNTNPDYAPLKQSYYSLAMSHPGEIVITAPRKSPLNGKLVVTIASTTKDGHGVIAMGIPLKEWTATANDFKLGKKGFIYMMDGKGNIIAHPTEELGELAKSNNYKEILIKDTGSMNHQEGKTLTREYFTTNRSTGWKIIGVIDQSEIDEAIQPIYKVTIFVFIFSVIMAAIIITLIVQWITKPLKSLTSASELVSKGDLSVQVDIKSNDEFQKVGKAYNQMISSLRTFAFYDPLTNLPNRRFFEKSLNSAIEKSAAVAIIFLDLDNFKRINDTQGHSVGDELLKAVATRLKQQLAPKDLVARFGGDEFIILIENAEDKEHIKQIAESLKQCFFKPFEVQQKLIHSKMSMGIAFFPEDGLTSEELLQNSDAAMYRVKEAGKNSYEFFHTSINDAVVKKSKLEQLLRSAFENQEFYVEYQPQFEIKTGAVKGFEALARWKSPDVGIVSPEEFIPIAEEMGLIVEIDEWVMREACFKAVELQRLFDKNFTMAINVSVLQLKRSEFVDTLRQVLEESTLKPEHLEIEITESMMIQSLESTLIILQKVRNLGVKVALDDFGTGYSSLNYLKELPTTTLKIDRSFITTVTSNEVEQAIVYSIVSLVHKLKQKVVAEGVETEEQLAFLDDCDCDIAQGYLLSRPLSEENLVKFLTPLYQN